MKHMISGSDETGSNDCIEKGWNENEIVQVQTFNDLKVCAYTISEKGNDVIFFVLVCNVSRRLLQAAE